MRKKKVSVTWRVCCNHTFVTFFIERKKNHTTIERAAFQLATLTFTPHIFLTEYHRLFTALTTSQSTFLTLHMHRNSSKSFTLQHFQHSLTHQITHINSRRQPPPTLATKYWTQYLHTKQKFYPSEIRSFPFGSRFILRVSGPPPLFYFFPFFSFPFRIFFLFFPIHLLVLSTSLSLFLNAYADRLSPILIYEIVGTISSSAVLQLLHYFVLSKWLKISSVSPGVAKGKWFIVLWILCRRADAGQVPNLMLWTWWFYALKVRDLAQCCWKPVSLRVKVCESQR